MIVYVNGEPHEVTEPLRLPDLLARVGVPAARGIAVALNGAVVPRSRQAETEVPAGARVEIVTAVQGG